MARSALSVNEVGAPARLSGGPSTTTNIAVVYSLLMAVQPTFDLELKEPQKSNRRTGGLQRSFSSKNRPN